MKGPDSVTTINTEGKGRGIVARRRIRKGKIVFKFVGELVSRKEVKNHNAALQLDEDVFLESDGTVDESLNHSCNPNCYVNFKELSLVALQDIQSGQELTFDYNTSEYDLVEQGCSFGCFCGTPDCIGEVKGFKYLSVYHKRKIEPFLSPFLRWKWKQEQQYQTGI